MTDAKQNDYASESKWQDYAKNNDRKTFLLLFKKKFPNLAATRYEKNEQFFIKMLQNPELMEMIASTLGRGLYDKLRA